MNLSTVGMWKHVKSDRSKELSEDETYALQNVLFDMMCDIVAFCEASGLDYTLGGGNALGAIRHHGFIPWDDDADMNLPRKDFDRFRELFPTVFGEKYELCTPDDTPGYNILSSRVRLRGTTLLAREDDPSAPGCHGVYVDLFPLENVPDNAFVRKAHGYRCMAVGLLQSCRTFAARADEYTRLTAEAPEDIRKAVRTKIGIGRVLSFASVGWWVRHANNVYKNCKNDASKYVTFPSGRNHYFGEMQLRSDMCPGKPAMFEGQPWNVPANPDAYLSKLYGDYMAIPPESGRESHVVLGFDLGDAWDPDNAPLDHARKVE